MAKFLAEQFWAPYPNAHDIVKTPNTNKIINDDLNIKTSDFTLYELRHTVNKAKRNKAQGLDELDMDIIKELDHINLKQIFKIINHWWNEETIPEEELLARICLLYKKGVQSNLFNYRPLAILPTLYKLYTSMINTRLMHKLDK